MYVEKKYKIVQCIKFLKFINHFFSPNVCEPSKHIEPLPASRRARFLWFSKLFKEKDPLDSCNNMKLMLRVCFGERLKRSRKVENNSMGSCVCCNTVEERGIIQDHLGKKRVFRVFTLSRKVGKLETRVSSVRPKFLNFSVLG